MPTALGKSSNIRTNIPAEQALNTLFKVSTSIANSQLRLSTGKRINSAADDVSGYITSRALLSRNSSLKTALVSSEEATHLTAIAQDSLDNISSLLSDIKDSAINASSDSIGTDEKVALSKAAFRLVQQVQFVVDSTVFGGRTLLNGEFQGDWTVGYSANNTILDFEINLKSDNEDFNIRSKSFRLNALNQSAEGYGNFAGVTGLNLASLNDTTDTNLGLFERNSVGLTISSISEALNNVSKVASYLGGIQNRLLSQNESLNSQITNYKSAISRIEDVDVAEEQLILTKSFFLETSSVIVLAQANQNPNSFLRLLN